MVDTRRSSSASKRFCAATSSSSRPTKRSKAAAEPASSSSASEVPIDNQAPVSDPGSISGDPELRTSDPQSNDAERPVTTTDVPAMETDTNPELEGLVTPTPAGEVVVEAEKSKSSKKRIAKAPWAKLLSQFPQNPHLVMRGSVFTVGRRACDLCIRDHSMPNVLCELRQSEHGGPSVASLEIIGNGVLVQVNGKIYQRSTCVHLRGGDEIIFTTPGKHAYIFQPLKDENLAAPDRTSSLSLFEAQSAPLKGLHVETRARDSSSVDGTASLLASISKLQNVPFLPPTAKSVKRQQNSEVPVLPSSCDDFILDVDLNDADSNNDHAAIASMEKTVASTSCAANDDHDADGNGMDPFQEPEAGNIPDPAYEIRPILSLLGDPSEFDLRGSISKILVDERREVREMPKEYERPSASVLTRRQAHKDSLRGGILNPQDIEVSFENFPYFLSGTTKDVLMISTYAHIKYGKEYAEYASDLPTACPRILLSGPSGSEIYQEMLAKALAKQCGAKLMIVDSLLLPGGSTPKEADTTKESSRRERLSVLAKRAVQAAQAAVLQHKKPISSVEAGITGGSTLSSQAVRRQEVSTATSKSYTFKAGDRVRFLGPSTSSLASLRAPPRGPATGFQGKVLLAFEGNGSSKIGVRFDRSIPDGNDLGGLCEEDHGFFCTASSLRLESSSSDDADKLAINEIFEVAFNESERGSLILFLKDIEKSVSGNTDVYITLKSKLENLPENIVVIASQTQLDNRKEKSHPGGFLFTKFGSNQTALLDLAFPDTFGGRLQDRNTEMPKAVKQITRLFPNKVTIQLPEDEASLVDWKDKLERDTEILKAQANITSIRAVLSNVFVGTVQRENDHVEDDDNVGSASVISPRVCDFDEDDAKVSGKENPLSPDDDDDVVFLGTIAGENQHVEDVNAGSEVCDILLDDANLRGEEKTYVSDEVVSLSSSSDDEEDPLEELGTDSREEVSGEDRDSGESDMDEDANDSDSSDYVGESSDSSDVESSDSDFVCSEDEEGGTRDDATCEKNPSEKVYHHKKSRTFRRKHNFDVINLLAKSMLESKDVFKEDIFSWDKIAEVDSREDPVVRESSSEKVNEHGKPRERRSFHRVREKNHLNGESFYGGEKLCDGEETINYSTEDSPPLNLRFGCEEPVLIEKTEEEKELDSLWEDMNVALTLEGMHSSTPDKNGDMLCSKGTHDFVLDDEIGLKCVHCAYVAVEIKDISPAMDKYRPSVNDNKKCSDRKGDPLPNRLEFDASDPSSFVAPLDNIEGTVWQYVPGIKDTLYPHQQEGFEFIWKNLAGTTKINELNSVGVKGSGGCIISHKAGTGKTRLTVVFLQSYLKRFPNSHPMVIAPATLMRTWEDEVRKWNVNIPFYNMNSLQLSGYEDAEAVSRLEGNRHHNSIRMVKLVSWWKQKSILGISYPLYEKLAANKNTEGMQVFRRMLVELPGLLVLDEGHTPRNQSSLIWKVLTEVRTEKRIFLSGTLFQNNFKELSNVLCLARPADKDTISSRIHELSKCSQEGEHGRVNEENRIVDLKAMIAHFVHVHEGTILQESLPGLRDCVVVLNPPFQQKKILDRIDTSQNTFEFEHKLSAVSVHPSLYLCCNPTKKEDLVIGPATLGTLKRLRLKYEEGVKTKFLIDFIRISGTVKEKVLVYSQYIDTLKLIMEQLIAECDWTEGEQILLMHGKVEQRDRQHMIDNFNKPDSGSKVLLASTKACSEGISLVGASRVVILDVVWNPSVESQAISRAFRIGQKRAVFIYHLMVKDTSEWNKYCKQSEKHRISELVFSSTNEKDKPINNEVVSKDRILDEMVRHEKLKHIFEKILYHPKKSDMNTSFF